MRLIKNKSIKSNSPRSLSATLATTFVMLSVASLLAVGSPLIYLNFKTEQEVIYNRQQLIASGAANEVSSFIKQMFSLLDTAARVEYESVAVTDKAQHLLVDKLLGSQAAFREVASLDSQGQLLALSSRLSLTGSSASIKYADPDILTQVRQGQHYVSSVYIDEVTSEPLVTIAVPVHNIFGEFQGVLVAEVNLKFMWDLVGELNIGQAGLAYVVDRQGNLIAFGDKSRVLRGENLSHLTEVAEFIDRADPFVEFNEAKFSVATGINGTSVIASYVPLGKPDWAVVVEIPVREIYQLVLVNLALSVGIVIVVVILAGITGIYASRRLAAPLLNLTQSATRIAEGEFNLAAAIEGPLEVVRLANAFNSMTAQLRELITSLERRVAERTHRLKIAATLGEQLNAILDFNQLLLELVNQVKESFGYYYVQVYIIDDNRENLMMMIGTGQVGVKMKRQNRSLALNTPTSVVAQAARTGEIVAVDNVREAKYWLLTPLLPDTYSEMAVPIIAEGQVVGVLDVQENRTGGLDEDDANLLRSLTNQVAVALTNARLFEQTTQAKEVAEQAREAAEAAKHTLEVQIWQTTGQAELSNKMRGEQDIPTLANSIMHQLCHYLRAQIGALYVVEEDNLKLVGRYAYSSKKAVQRFKLGEGLVGQAALGKQPMLVTDVPQEYIMVRSALGETVPRNIMLFPFIHEDRVGGVIELGTLTGFTQAEMEFVQKALDNIAIAFNTAQARAHIDVLLAQTQQQTKDLQAQEEALRIVNQELENQAASLKASESKLKEQQTELEATNTHLEEQTAALEESSQELKKKQAILDNQNQELKAAHQELTKQTEELARASKYKSEFLANMSHELRTPLNSLLILARMLVDNEEGNLTADQVESAQIIYSGGKELLTLINDILDLAKVESGKLIFTFEAMFLSDLAAMAQAQFTPIAKEKGLELNITLAEDLPGSIETDPQRVKQIIKNLLSNAFKFTSQGKVSLTVERPAAQIDLSRNGLNPSQVIAISVTDTGIGMTAEQQKIIFEAFQQADGSTSRQYGGTGLGLSISRELVAKLGGQIDVTSEPNRGSTFTLYLPIHKPAHVPKRPPPTVHDQPMPDLTPITIRPASRPTRQPAFPDDRTELKADDKLLLVIEDDPTFAKILFDFAHKKGFKCLIAINGQDGLELVRTYQPQAITLDLHLPDIDGWQVLESLKNDPATRHIPVHIISADEEDMEAFRKGAIGYLTKPVSQAALADSFKKIKEFNARQIKDLLLVEVDDIARQNIKNLLDGSDLRITEADRGQTALELLKIQQFDCMILDLNLPDMSGFDFLNHLNGHKSKARCPVIVYTNQGLTPEENRALTQFADHVILKGVKSPERLLDETALFLHRVVAEMPTDKQRAIKQLYDQEAQLKDKKILIVDDDLRNSFALSKLLSDKGLIVKIAQDGQHALNLLAKETVDLILMDIMMPVMDGYETIKQLRLRPEFKTLPILALTAKVMTGDREKCLAAGANDYLPKPVDADRLFSMLRVWLYQ